MTRTLKIAKDNFKNNDSDTFKHKQRLVAIKKTQQLVCVQIPRDFINNDHNDFQVI